MSAPGSLVPSNSSAELTRDGPANQLQSWGPPPAPATPPAGGLSIARYLAALRRYKWLIIGMVALGGVAGVIATKFVKPKYEVYARVMIAEPPDPRGPIRAGSVLNEAAWRELLTSFAILDPVARSLRLYVVPASESDDPLFAEFEHTSELRPGKYALAIDAATRRYELSRKSGSERSLVERGALGDSIGRSVGFLWAPGAEAFAGRSELLFEVRTPRDAASDIERRLIVVLPLESRF